MNKILLSAIIEKVYPIKYTLQKLPILSFVARHESQQLEGENMRLVKCKIYCIKIGEISEIAIDKLVNSMVSMVGFLANNAQSQIVLHVTELQFLKKGLENVSSKC